MNKEIPWQSQGLMERHTLLPLISASAHHCSGPVVAVSFPFFPFLKVFYNPVPHLPLCFWWVEVGRIDHLFSRRWAYERVTGGPDEGNAYHLEVLDFEINAVARWNFVLFHWNGEKWFYAG